ELAPLALLDGTFALDRKAAVLHVDLDLLRLDARQIGEQHVTVFLLEDVHGGRPVARGDVAPGFARPLGDAAHLVAELLHEAPWIVLVQSHCIPPVVRTGAGRRPLTVNMGGAAGISSVTRAPRAVCY